MTSVSENSCRGNQNTHFMISNFFFENRAVYKILWENIVKRGTPEMTYVACALHAG